MISTLHLLYSILALTIVLHSSPHAFATPLQSAVHHSSSLTSSLPTNNATTTANTTTFAPLTNNPKIETSITSYFDPAYVDGPRYPIHTFILLLASLQNQLIHRVFSAPFTRVTATSGTGDKFLQMGLYATGPHGRFARGMTNHAAVALCEHVLDALEELSRELSEKGRPEEIPNWCWAYYVNWDWASIARGWVGHWPGGWQVHPCGYQDVYSLGAAGGGETT